jgi:hypothetical protein
MKMFIVFAAAAVLTSATAFAGDKAQQEGPNPRIGAQVDKICFASNINGWKEIDGIDDAVLLETGVKNWNYVQLNGGCEARLFRMAEAIGIENRPAGGCLRQGDVIVVNDAGRFARRCFIRKIYEWNDDLPKTDDSVKAD